MVRALVTSLKRLKLHLTLTQSAIEALQPPLVRLLNRPDKFEPITLLFQPL